MSIQRPHTALKWTFPLLIAVALAFNLFFDYSTHQKMKSLNDITEVVEIEQRVLSALGIDFFLFLLLLCIFLIYNHSRQKMEEQMQESLEDLRLLNRRLENEIVKKQIKHKTTVHDLKNPLGSIHGFADLIAGEADENPSILKFSETIKRISRNSLDLVDSLLTPESEKNSNVELVDLISILDEVMVQAHGQALVKQQTLLTDYPFDPLFVTGNRTELEEAVFNLVGNAIKYAPHKSKIWVRAWKIKHSIHVEIEDQGPGFSTEDLRSAFNYGQTLSALPTGNEKSTGIGLYSVKEIIQKHQGTIAIGNAENRSGARVFFELPLADVQETFREIPTNP